MKKLILTSLTAVAMMAAAVSSNAQGTVNFSSSAGGSCLVSNTTTGATSKIASGTYAFGLYVGATAGTISSTPVLQITNSGFAGIISGSTFTVNGGLSTGSTYFFVVKGWTAAAGSTFESAQTSLLAGTAVGVSAVGQFTAGGGSTPAGNLFGTSGTTVATPILLTPVPEPSTMVLGGLGIAALAFFRRRK